jgi:tRNA nucleotidyltransferase (CCA-adding enzyme)
MDLIFTHEHADFDAVASQLAVHKLIPEARPMLANRLNRNVRHFVRLYWDTLPFIEHKDVPKQHVNRVWVVDSQSLQKIRGIDKYTQVEVIDHHALRGELPNSWKVRIEEVGANTTLLVERIQEAHIPLTSIEATLLALGIYEDTGSLSYGTTTPRDAYAAAWLLDQGAVLDVLRDFLNHPLASDQRELYEQLVENVESIEVDGHSIVIATATAPEMVEEISVLAHKLRDMFDPAALFLLVDLGSHIQMVARSSVDALHVGAIADQFGGGGHGRAAAAVIRGSTLDATRTKLLEIVPQMLRPTITVADIMSKGVQTLAPGITAQNAAELMRRYGYEGFPVVEGERIVGLLTRRAVDRALDHGLTGIKIEQIMEAGDVTVGPDQPLSALQQIMMISGWGQVPVTSDGRLLGVVTRTDLIKHLGHMKPSPSRQSEIARRMEQALPLALMGLVREVGQIAQAQGLHLYVVGGFVRDLLLGLPTGDMDFVVEGDAIKLAKAVQQKLGGRIRTHGRFGTGKWMLDSGDWPRLAEQLDVEADPAKLPDHLDFVSARTEFYEAPTKLPEIEHSSIKLDLHRRDFTINTLAISLDPKDFGQLLDFYGGEADLKEKRIRVLHSLSFVDDPTRILRGVRLEQRLGFTIVPPTVELIRLFAPLLDRVSGDRIRHEIEFILDEAQPENALCRLADLGILQAIGAELACDAWLKTTYADLRVAHQEPLWPEIGSDFDLAVPYFGLLTYRLEADAMSAVCRRLKVQRRTEADIARIQMLQNRMGELSQPLKASALDRVLDGANDQVLITVWAAESDEIARQNIVEYARVIRKIMPETTGTDLIARGLKPGPLFSRVLKSLRNAWLDGEIQTSDQEMRLLEDLLMEAH